jgi:hypothetical protein
LDTRLITSILERGEIDISGQFMHGSNYTFLATVKLQGGEIKAVYKPVRGEQPLWDFPAGTLAKREVAAWLVSEKLGWSLVPPTLYRRKAPVGPGSLQLFIEHDPESHYFKFNAELRQLLRPMVLFDLLVNNADRKGSHVFFDAQRHLWGIDHGICFNVDDKLRTVIWDFAGESIPAGLLADVGGFLVALEEEDGFRQPLARLLRKSEMAAMAARARQILSEGLFPQPREDRRYFPWPPV